MKNSSNSNRETLNEKLITSLENLQNALCLEPEKKLAYVINSDMKNYIESRRYKCNDDCSVCCWASA